MTSTSVSRSVVVCFLGVVVGCSVGSGGEIDAPVVRDSAGIRIVENTQPRWADGRGWVLASEPSVVIGGLREEPGHDLGWPKEAWRLADGGMVVLDGGSQELRFFDGNGTFRFASGGKGEGPGEFRGLVWVRRFGVDSLWAYDARLRRISVFDVNGVFHRSFNLPTPDGRVISATDVLDDGSLIVVGIPSGLEPSRRGLVRREGHLYRYRPLERSLDTLEVMYFREAYVQPYGPGGQGGLAIPVPFTRSQEFEVLRDVVLVVDTDRFEVLEYGLDGGLQSIFRKAHLGVAVTGEDIDRAYDLLYHRSSRDFIRKAVAAAFRDFEFPATMPATGRWAWERVGSTRPALHGLEVDDAGNVWVLEYNPPGNNQRRWTVFDAEGVLLGTVPFPIGFDPLHIGDDFVLGWRLGELEEISVELYGLVKSKK